MVDSGGSVSVYGEGLTKGEVGKQASFYVDAKSGKGNLYVQVDGKCYMFNIKKIKLFNFEPLSSM